MVISETAPVPLVVRSTVASWITTMCRSRAMWTSSSRPPAPLPQDQGYRAGQPCECDQDEVLSAHQQNLAQSGLLEAQRGRFANLRGGFETRPYKQVQAVDPTMCLSYTQRATLSEWRNW